MLEGCLGCPQKGLEILIADVILSQRIGPTTPAPLGEAPPPGSPGSSFTEKFVKIKLLIGLKVTAWIRFRTSMGIRWKLGAVPGGQHHLDPQEHVFQKNAIKQSYL